MPSVSREEKAAIKAEKARLKDEAKSAKALALMEKKLAKEAAKREQKNAKLNKREGKLLRKIKTGDSDSSIDKNRAPEDTTVPVITTEDVGSQSSALDSRHHTGGFWFQGRKRKSPLQQSMTGSQLGTARAAANVATKKGDGDGIVVGDSNANTTSQQTLAKAAAVLGVEQSDLSKYNPPKLRINLSPSMSQQRSMRQIGDQTPIHRRLTTMRARSKVARQTIDKHMVLDHNVDGTTSIEQDRSSIVQGYDGSTDVQLGQVEMCIGSKSTRKRRNSAGNIGGPGLSVDEKFTEKVEELSFVSKYENISFPSPVDVQEIEPLITVEESSSEIDSRLSNFKDRAPLFPTAVLEEVTTSIPWPTESNGGYQIDVSDTIQLLKWLESGPVEPSVCSDILKLLDQQEALHSERLAWMQAIGIKSNFESAVSSIYEKDPRKILMNRVMDAMGMLRARFNITEAFVITLTEWTGPGTYVLNRMRSADEATNQLKKWMEEWKITIPALIAGDIAEKQTSACESIPLQPAANDDSVISVHRILGMRKLASEGVVEFNSLDDDADAPQIQSPDHQSAYKQGLATYKQRRESLTKSVVPSVNADSTRYDREFAKIMEIKEELVAAAKISSLAKQIPQYVPTDEGNVIASDENLKKLTVDSRSDAPDPFSPAFPSYARWMASHTTVATMLILSKITKTICGIVQLKAGMVKSLPALLLKSMIRYGCDFSSCSDVARCTVVVESLTSMLELISTIFTSPLIYVSRLRNGFDDNMSVCTYEYSTGGFRSCQLICLVHVGRSYKKCEIRITTPAFHMISESRENSGTVHERYLQARDTDMLLPSVLEYSGPISHGILERVAGGLLRKLDVSFRDKDSTSKQRNGPFEDKEYLHKICTTLSAPMCLLNTLKFDRCRLGAESVELLGKSLVKCRTIRVLTMESVGMGKQGGLALAKILGAWDHLQELDLGNNGIGDAAGVSLLKSLSSSKHLQYLDLHDNELGLETAISLGALISQSHCLLAINLGNNPFGAIGGVPIVEGLSSSVAAKISNLQRISLRNCKFEKNCTDAISKALLSTNSISYLDLWGNKLGDAGGAKIISAIGQNQVQTIAELNLNHTGLGEMAGKALTNCLGANSKIANLYLRYNSLDDSAGIEIGNALKNNSALISLDLFRNRIGNVGGVAIGDGLREGSVAGTIALVELDLGCNLLGEAAGQSLGAAIAVNTSLTKLSLGGNGVAATGKPNRQLDRLHAAIPKDFSWGAGIGDAGGIAVAQGMVPNNTLTELYLQANRLGDAGGIAMAKMLQDKYTLEKLNLAFNDYTSAARQALSIVKVENGSCAMTF